MKQYIVYMHRNKINNKVYIGLTTQTAQNRWRSQGQGYKSQEKFYNAIQKYGWENFEHIILFENLSAQEAAQKEQELIQLFNSIYNGYNISPGGIITNHSEETKEKIRQAMIGKTHTEQTKLLLQQQKTNISKRVQCIETGQIYASLGEAARNTGIDKTSIGRCCAKKQSSAGGLHWAFEGDLTPPIEDKRKKTPVLCITTNKAYATLTEAAKDTNLDISNIRKVCIGKYKTTGGKSWKYITQQEYERYQGGFQENGEDN